MSYFQDLETYTLEAAADLSGKQYHVMRQTDVAKCDIASNAVDDALVGVLQNKPQSGEFATIADGGISKVVVGAAVTQGENLTHNSSGRAITVTSGDVIFGMALETAGADGQIISARLNRQVNVT